MFTVKFTSSIVFMLVMSCSLQCLQATHKDLSVYLQDLLSELTNDLVNYM